MSRTKLLLDLVESVRSTADCGKACRSAAEAEIGSNSRDGTGACGAAFPKRET